MSATGTTMIQTAPAVAPAPRGRAGAVALVVLGLLLLIAPGGLLTTAGATGLGLEDNRDESGFVSSPSVEVSTETAAVTVTDLDLDIDAEAAAWIPARYREIRLRATSTDGGAVFVGIALQADVDAWLASVAHDEITSIEGRDVSYRRLDGRSNLGSAEDQTFWVASAAGPATNQILWPVENGRWAVVLAAADGAPGLQADVEVAGRAPNLTGVSVVALVIGLILLALGIGLVVLGATGLTRRVPPPRHDEGELMSDLGQTPTTDPLRKAAIERLEAKRGFSVHLLSFVLVISFLVVIWATSGGGFFWPLYPFFGWGIGLAFHAFGVFSPDHTEDRIAAEMRRASARTTS